MNNMDDVWTVLYSAPEDGPKSTTGDVALDDSGNRRRRFAPALDRALTISRPERVIASLLESERPWWQAAAARLPVGSHLAQPIDRGSGVGLLVALLRIERVAPDAPVVLFTTDDLCADAAQLARAALDRLEEAPYRIHVVGRAPEVAQRRCGLWLVPRDAGDREVSSLVFDPSPDTSRYLASQGGVVATPIVVGRVKALLAAYEDARPDVVEQCLDVIAPDRHHDADVLDELYPFVDAVDFHRDVLAAVPERLRLERRGLAYGTTWAADSAVYRPSSTNSVAV